MTLEGKAALITGAASGIGRASAIAFAAEGLAVMCADIDEEGAQDTAALVAEGGGRSAALRLDVSQEAEVERALHETVEELVLYAAFAGVHYWLGYSVIALLA